MRNKILEIINKNKSKKFVEDKNNSFLFEDILYIFNSLNNIKDKKIGLYFDKSSKYVLSLISVFLTSNSFTPLNKKEAIERLNYFIEDAKLDYILTSKEYNISILPDNIPVLFIEDFLCNKKINNIELLNKKEIYTLYTSGSTGKPKGVIIQNELALYNVINQQINILNLNNENIFFYLSISFDASLSDIFCSLLSSSCLYINDDILLKRKSIVSFFNDNKITYSDIPPSILKLINPKSFKTLSKILVGGEKPNKNSVLDYLNCNIKVLNVYGPTEVSICTSMVLCDKNWIPKDIGIPIKGVEYKIIENELYISSNGLAKGYTNQKITKERFEFIDGKRYYKTGDLIRFIDNKYLFFGRKDRQIKHNGQLICLEEIEENIRKLEKIDNTCVIYKNNKIINIYEGEASEIEIKSKLLSLLPKYMHPSKHIKSKIIKTQTGKNDAKKMSETFSI